MGLFLRLDITQMINYVYWVIANTCYLRSTDLICDISVWLTFIACYMELTLCTYLFCIGAVDVAVFTIVPLLEYKAHCPSDHCCQPRTNS